MRGHRGVDARVLGTLDHHRVRLRAADRATTCGDESDDDQRGDSWPDAISTTRAARVAGKFSDLRSGSGASTVRTPQHAVWQSSTCDIRVADARRWWSPFSCSLTARPPAPMTAPTTRTQVEGDVPRRRVRQRRPIPERFDAQDDRRALQARWRDLRVVQASVGRQGAGVHREAAARGSADDRGLSVRRRRPVERARRVPRRDRADDDLARGRRRRPRDRHDRAKDGSRPTSTRSATDIRRLYRAAHSTTKSLQEASHSSCRARS